MSSFSTFEVFMVKTIPEKIMEQSVHFDTTQTGQIPPWSHPIQMASRFGIWEFRISRDDGGTQFMACNVPRASEVSREKANSVLKDVHRARRRHDGDHRAWRRQLHGDRDQRKVEARTGRQK